MDEKELLTKNRTRPYFQIENGSLREIEEKWGKYCFLPLDIPPFSESKKIAEWFFQNAKPSLKRKPDIATPRTGHSGFNAVDIIVDEKKDDTIWEMHTKHNFLEEFPKFHQELLDLFPHVKIPHIRLWQSTGYVIKHRDDYDFRDFPSSFRAMLYDENPKETLYIEEYLPNATSEVPEKSMPIPRLEESQSFVWNNLRTKHHSVFDSRYRKIILIIPAPIIDYKKYDQLLERSLVKYSNYAMVSDHSINDFVNNPYRFSNLPKNEIIKIIKKDKT